MKKLAAMLLASGLLFVAAPAASADVGGPGYAACKAVSNAYTFATGDQPPWYCLY